MNTESAETIEEEELDTDAGEQSVDDTAAEAQEPINPLALSDEEVMAMDGPPGTESEPDQPDEPAAKPEPEAEPEPDADAPDDDSNDAEPDETPAEPDTQEDSEGKEPERDIAAEHARLFAPLKAGGQTIEIKSVDEIISLMQKGADYHRKTEELSHHRRTIKTLEKAGIKSENLDYLIDLHNKDPKAIAKLIADSGVDPFELDTESEETKNYKPKQHTVSEGDINFEDDIAKLKATPTWDKLISVVGNQWDEESRVTAANNTNVLNVINDHMEIGIYDEINKELTRQRTLGNLQGLSDLAAYQQVGEAIDAQGGFNHLITPEYRARWAQKNGHTMAPIAVRPKQGSSDPNLDAKRRAASPAKAASPTPKKTSNQTNPLALSDAEFEKQFSSSLN